MKTDVAIRILQPTDLQFVDPFVAAAGWNQLHEDWLRVVSFEPQGCFAAWSGDQLVGTVTTTTYGRDLGWIGMMLVHSEFRRRGIATALMKQSIRYLREREVACIKLDATPAGRPVYEKLGFEVEWDFQRWERPSMNSPDVLTPVDSPWSASLSLDQAAFGTDRSRWLAELARHSVTVHSGEGYGFLRSGRRAAYLGPVVAASPASAESIIQALMNHVSGPVFWDAPETNRQAVPLVQQLHFRPVRVLTRMRMGHMRVEPDLPLQYAIAAPETG
ncbi:MAG: GNAT family N-acetyltransferase [Planctomycetaceae bacterium]|nr:GNAT family N-acetyltransferase [Planctomycetaceae bacterium]